MKTFYRQLLVLFTITYLNGKLHSSMKSHGEVSAIENNYL